MPLFVRSYLPLVILSIATLPAVAQDTPSPTDPAVPDHPPAAAQDTPSPAVPAVPDRSPAAAQGDSSAAEPGPKRLAYEKQFGQWKKLLGELRDLRNEYPGADDDRKKEIESRYDELVEQGDTMQEALVAAALQANAESPGTDVNLARFLMGILLWQCAGDDFEKAFEHGQKLIESGLKDDALYALTGLAAIAVNEFDVAEEYFQAAKEKDALGVLEELGPDNPLKEIGKVYADVIAYYKEAWPKEAKIRAAEAAADDLPRVLITTEHGPIEVELFENEAPNTVANFISLVKKGFYDGLTFHRVLSGFMAQGGCPQGDGTGGPGYHIACECYQENHRLHFRGSLSMAHAGKDTGGSQFFLTFWPTSFLDGRHTVFGRVVKGFEVLAKIRRRKPEEGGEAEKIVKMEVLRDRGHEYKPKKVE